MSAPPPAAAAADSSDDWRKSVPQSYRSEEVRNIAKVLASLEPGATSASKLMLAMRFEDAIFQSASSLADYRKRLTKRLKKVQKSYKPPSEADSSASAAGDESGLSAAEAARKRDLETERELRARFGDELRFIVKHAAEAVEAMKEKHGSSRSEVLRQHTDNAEQWAVEIGLGGCGDTPSFRARRRRVPREAGYLDRLRSHLEQRVDNIRSHVVKLTRPDLFLEETLVRLEEDMSGGTADELAAVTAAALTKMGHAAPASDAAGVRRLLERATAPAPIPRRGRKGDVRDASLAHVEKVRAASQALVGYMSLGRDGKAEVKGALRKAHSAAVDSVSHLAGAGFDDDGSKEGEIQLEDAWNRAMEYKSEKDESEVTSVDETAAVDEPEKKRPRTDSAGSSGGGGTTKNAVVIRSKVLLSPGRKVPSNLRAALRRKKAELIQPPGNVAGYASTRIRLEFGTAFDMTVNFTPLLVTIRALPQKQQPDETTAGKTGTKSPPNLGEEEDCEEESDFRRKIVDGGLPTSIPPSYGLAPRNPATAAAKPRQLSVLGVPGTAATIGHLVAGKLEYASAHATHVLRRCFADLAGRAYANPTGSDFEIEILESTALLRFLQIARSTYCPGWQDAES